MSMSPEALKRLEEQAAKLESQLTAVQSDDPYTQLRVTFNQTSPDERSSFAATPSEYRTNATGQVLFGNGVIADPTSGQVLYGGLRVPGSEPWLASIQDSWDAQQVNKWRKDLARQGYQVAESGGWAVDLVNALRDYHRTRYLNFGKPLPLTPESGGGTAAAVRKSFDMEAVRNTVKSWGDIVFGEQLDDDTSEWLAERQIELAVELAKKNPEWSIEQVQSGAELRTQKEFTKLPGVKGTIREAEQLEGSTKLRDHMVSLSQVTAV